MKVRQLLRICLGASKPLELSDQAAMRMSRSAFEAWNENRMNYGLPPLLWDDRIYRRAYQNASILTREKSARRHKTNNSSGLRMVSTMMHSSHLVTDMERLIALEIRSRPGLQFDEDLLMRECDKYGAIAIYSRRGRLNMTLAICNNPKELKRTLSLRRGNLD